jgi:hypothetical protein
MEESSSSDLIEDLTSHLQVIAFFTSVVFPDRNVSKAYELGYSDRRLLPSALPRPIFEL